MNRLLTTLACASALAFAAPAFAAPDMALTRLDCGTPQAPIAVNQRFSDIYAYGDLKLQFVFSCYLVKHGDDYLLWDTGHAMTAPNVAPKVSIVDQLAKLGLKPDQIKYVGISHKPFEGWTKGENKFEALVTDKDVFGDGSVIVLYTPGHTPGHHSLLVKLPQSGAVIISGDATHFRENYDSDGVPWFNYDRAQTVASLERLKKIAANLKATVIIQHDARDIDKLPAFPGSAK